MHTPQYPPKPTASKTEPTSFPQTTTTTTGTCLSPLSGAPCPPTQPTIPAPTAAPSPQQPRRLAAVLFCCALVAAAATTMMRLPLASAFTPIYRRATAAAALTAMPMAPMRVCCALFG